MLFLRSHKDIIVLFLFECLFYVRLSDFCNIFVRHVMGALIMTFMERTKKTFNSCGYRTRDISILSRLPKPFDQGAIFMEKKRI